MTIPALLLYAAWLTLTLWFGYWAFMFAREAYEQRTATPPNNQTNWPAFWGYVVSYTLYLCISLFLMLVYVSGVPVHR